MGAGVGVVQELSQDTVIFSTKEQYILLTGLLILFLAKPWLLLTVFKWVIVVVTANVLTLLIFQKRHEKTITDPTREPTVLINQEKDVTLPNLPGSPLGK